MKILIRCDSSFLIGTGHVFRCLNLANILQKAGHEVLFACRILEGNVIQLIVKKQFKIISLPAPSAPNDAQELYLKWLAVPLQQEMTEMNELLDEVQPDWVIVDHYALSREWEEACLQHGVKVMAIDEISRPHHAHLLLDQSYVSKLPHPSLENSVILQGRLIGPAYALLSEDFLAREARTSLNPTVRKVLIFCGGTDPGGLTLRLLQLLGSNPLHFDAVVGIHNVELEKIKAFCLNHPSIHLHVQTEKMAELMQNSDLFVGAGGITTWERATLGLPSLVLSIAENQHEFSRDLGLQGVQTYLGMENEVTDEVILKRFLEIIADFSLRKSMQEKCFALKVASRFSEIPQWIDSTRGN